MSRLRIVLARLIGAFRPNRLDADLRAQIDEHIAEATDEYLRRGVPAAEAQRRALRDFGGVARVEEEYRDVQAAWLRDLTSDVRYGARTLRRDPAFATVAIVSLAIGIGANTAIFSIFNSLVLRPRPIADPERIVELYTGERAGSVEGTSYPSYLDFRNRSGIFTGLAAYGIRQYRLGDAAGGVEQIWGELVSANYFDVLGVPLAGGRGLLAEENEVPGRHPIRLRCHLAFRTVAHADGRRFSVTERRHRNVELFQTVHGDADVVRVNVAGHTSIENHKNARQSPSRPGL